MGEITELLAEMMRSSVVWGLQMEAKGLRNGRDYGTIGRNDEKFRSMGLANGNKGVREGMRLRNYQRKR